MTVKIASVNAETSYRHLYPILTELDGLSKIRPVMATDVFDASKPLIPSQLITPISYS